MGLPQQAIDSILNLTNEARFNYAVKRIADSRVLYVLADDEENWELLRDGECAFLPIWTATEFAQMYLTKEDNDLNVCEIDLEDFLNDDIPYLMENKVDIALFPILENPKTTTLSPLQFAQIISDILNERYGEITDLPYLMRK